MKLKFNINIKKLKEMFFWLINWGQWIKSPIKCKRIKVNKTLLGEKYLFSELKSWKVKNPMKGKVKRIYKDGSIQIVNERNLQIIIGIETKKRDWNLELQAREIFKCEINEEEEIDSNEIIFNIFLRDEIENVFLIIPWQPEILDKINNYEDSEDYFVKLLYKNPYEKINLKENGNY